MDYVSGELLIYRLKRCPEMEKKLLFEWMRDLLHQIEQFHRCRGNQSYRYVNPYSVLVTADDRLLLLDLEAESNEFVLRNMQKRAMRDHFVKPVIYIRENTKLSLDLYGYAKTIQFILANVQVEPSLTSREENRLEKIIDKCLCKNSKKHYEDFKQLQRELPSVHTHNWKPKMEFRKKWLILPVIAIAFLAIAAIFFIRLPGADGGTQKNQEQTEQKTQEQEELSELQGQSGGESPDMEEEPGAFDDTQETRRREEQQLSRDGMRELEEDVDALQEYVLRNTAQDNREIIAQGEDLKRELLRYLATAYDREERKEEALEAYQELCGTEVRPELLEAAYLRRLTLEMEQSRETALETGKEALSQLPDSEPLAEKVLEILSGMEAMTKEECRRELEALADCCPDLKKSKNYQKLEELYGFTEGGNTDDEKEDAPAGN